ncbi:MAG: AAA domain-containing protein, partial [Bacteroidota bacterium]|nr:AAA domain-containing protein [Bacteroidota bacterium]
TGKTTTIIHSILHTLKDEKQVLVCAPSNAAVDLLVEKLAKKGASVVRIGHPARVTKTILNRTLDFLISNHEDYSNLRVVRKQADEYRKLAGKYKRNFEKEERQQRKLLYSEARKLRDEAKQLAFYITNNVISNAQVIACTMIGANNYYIKERTFSTVFIDEAAQGLEPATWIPIIKADRVIFAGDHFQLPPTVKSFNAAKQGLSTTLFEKTIDRNNADVMLEEQYRMNEKIMNFSAEYFYKNKLFANKAVKNHLVFEHDKAVEFVDTAGIGFAEEINEETKSTFNREEAELLFKHLIDYLYIVEKKEKQSEIENIAVISPYKAQIVFMQEYFNESVILPDEIKAKISINTIDSFQGQERDVIYISLVRSNQNGQIGFLSDVRRMNVAMTRARKKLVIFGDSGTICKHKFYDKFVDYVNRIDAYKSAYEILY